LLERGAERGHAVLSFPLVNWMFKWRWTLPGAGYVPILTNSLLWAVLLVGIAAGYRRCRPRPSSAPVDL
jgi:hypothetical protein